MLSLPPQEGAVELTVLIPCLNEAKTVGRCVAKACAWLAQRRVEGEVVVADNGSTDGSQAVAAQAGARVLSVEAKGYGNALMEGVAASRGRYVIMGDADDSYDFSALDPFLEPLRQGYDLVMGNRFLGGIKPGAMPPLNRYFGNPLLTFLGRFFFRSPVGDFYCGLRGFSRASAMRMSLVSSGMEFAIEMIVKATLLGMRVTEVPVTLWPDGRGRRSHLRPWRDGWRTLRFFLIYSPRWLFWYPGFALMLSGVGIGLWILREPTAPSRVTYDVHMLLNAAMLVLIGFQGMSFAAFTKLFAISEGLLPEDPRLKRWFRVANLETGLAAGGLLMASGAAGVLYAIARWDAGTMGPLEMGVSMRLVIPSLTVLVLGCQGVLASFFMSILWLRRRRAPAG